MRLALADVQRDALDVVVNELKRTGTVVISDVVDVAQATQVQRFAEHAFSAFGNVHLLINNAGVGGGGYVWENTARDWQWVMGVNLMGVVHGVQPSSRACSSPPARRDGHFVNTAPCRLACGAVMGAYNVSSMPWLRCRRRLSLLKLRSRRLAFSGLCPARTARQRAVASLPAG